MSTRRGFIGGALATIGAVLHDLAEPAASRDMSRFTEPERHPPKGADDVREIVEARVRHNMEYCLHRMTVHQPISKGDKWCVILQASGPHGWGDACTDHFQPIYVGLDAPGTDVERAADFACTQLLGSLLRCSTRSREDREARSVFSKGIVSPGEARRRLS